MVKSLEIKVLNDYMHQLCGDLKHKILTNHVSAICFKLQRGMKLSVFYTRRDGGCKRNWAWKWSLVQAS